MMVLLRSKLLIDGTGNPPIPEGVVLIRDNQIADVGDASIVKDEEDCNVIDCSDETVLPGLVSSHTHFFSRLPDHLVKTVEISKRQLEISAPIKHILAYNNILRSMRGGVITMRSLGSHDASDVEIRDAINSGYLIGPRIVASGIPIRPTHGTARFVAKPADGVDEVRKAVRENIRDGVDVIKIFATNTQEGEGEIAYRRGDLTRTIGYTKREMEAIVEEAHNAGKKVAAHAIGGPSLRWAIESLVDSVEHANLMEEDDIDYLIKYNCVLSDPNLYLFFDRKYGFDSRISLRELPLWWKQKVEFAREQTRVQHRKAFESGVRFTLGLDSNHGFIWREAKCMVEILGASPMDAIMSLTKFGAEICGMENVGTLQKGKSADIISVKGNPLENIANLKNVRLIMKDGKRYEQKLQREEV
jgi:imidazolonepropionase-like amidohydrolase